jgi:GLPGLI family protein
MMRYYTTFLFFILSILFLNAQQSAVVIYKAELNTDKERYLKYKDKLGENMVNRMKQKDARINEILKDFSFKLQFNPTESRYEWEEDMPDETVNQSVFLLSKLAGGGLAVHYTNMKENLYLKQFQEVSTGRLVRETAPLVQKDWHITKETDTILGYPVIKAVKGKTEAWFTSSIPVPFGPAEARGLPGLILKYNFNNTRIIYADKIKWLKKNLNIKRPKKGLLRTQKEGRAQRMKEMGRMLNK